MFNVFALLLDDALLKCVFTEVRLVFNFAFKTLTFHSDTTYGRIFSNSIITNVVRSIFDEVKAYKTVFQFFGPPCIDKIDHFSNFLAYVID